MAARLWMVVLALAAVFAMHGLQCTTAADGAGHPATPAGHAEALALSMTAVTHGHGAAIATVSTAVTSVAGHADSGPATPAGTAVPTTAAGHGGAPHDAAAHLWTLCLAVLAVALAVLLALLVPRVVQLTAPALGYARARFRSSPLRPPDLSALCLLRI